MFCKKKSDFKSWGVQFNTLSPPIKKLGGGHVPNAQWANIGGHGHFCIYDSN